MVAYGWQAVAQIWAVAGGHGGVFFLSGQGRSGSGRAQDQRRRPKGLKQLEPLKNEQVWRFSLYYFFVFGAFVALALWLPKYLIGVYGLDIKVAGMLAAAFSIPAACSAPMAGILSDRYGARRIMYGPSACRWSAPSCCPIRRPTTRSTGSRATISLLHLDGLIPFVMVVFVLGFFMSLGKAAVYKHIPVYYPACRLGRRRGRPGRRPRRVRPADRLRRAQRPDRASGPAASCCCSLLVAVALAWMHFAIRQMEQKASGIDERRCRSCRKWPNCTARAGQGQSAAPPPQGARPTGGPRIPPSGRKPASASPIATSGSRSPLLLAFAVWMVWSVVVAKLPSIGFNYTTDQLFWLAALPGLSGATLRIFYSASWCRSSAGGCGPRSPPRRC
jgi:NNP family nitrate/nitrite transporter-like MFS transporter